MTIHERIDQLDLDVFRTIESQTSPDDRRSFPALRVRPADLNPPDLCLIDGGHTDEGVLRDTRFRLNVMGPIA